MVTAIIEGHDVYVALDGPSGLELFDRLRPQIVLCDIGLPGTDGYAVVAHMRARDQLPKPTIVALTGYDGPQDFQRALQAGFDQHIVKPAEPEAIAISRRGEAGEMNSLRMSIVATVCNSTRRRVDGRRFDGTAPPDRWTNGSRLITTGQLIADPVRL